ncbi:hypothetical protein RXP11_29850, partial [Pseudomonas aeruginosa]|nr:hypothetical protein [Pseudomonas aeruginosa]
MSNEEYLREELEKAKQTLKSIAKWFGEFPVTGEYWSTGEPISYSIVNGAGGEREYMRAKAYDGLASIRLTLEGLYTK